MRGTTLRHNVRVITSTANPLCRRVRALARRRTREREGAFVVEGLQPVWRAVDSGWKVEALLVAPELVRQERALAMSDAVRGAGVRVEEVSADVARSLSERDAPGGMWAIVRSRPWALAKLGAGLVIALERAANPGNIGTVLRTADALGAAGVVLCGESADAYAPAAVKASMGSVFAVPAPRCSTAELLDWARDGGRRVLATSPVGALSPAEADLAGAVVLFGNEGDGLDAATIEAADARVAIAMTGTAESLNLAASVAIIAYEASRP